MKRIDHLMRQRLLPIDGGVITPQEKAQPKASVLAAEVYMCSETPNRSFPFLSWLWAALSLSRKAGRFRPALSRSHSLMADIFPGHLIYVDCCGRDYVDYLRF